MNIEKYLDAKSQLTNKYLDRFLPKTSEYPSIAHKSMRYTVMSGGKRLRAILVIASAECVGGKAEWVMPTACAIEMIHNYSLIHDDLPAMDNDDFRRGKPTNHKVFGEAMAILSGDGLLVHSFSVMAGNAGIHGIKPSSALNVIKEISIACGSYGMVGGQVIDILSQGKNVSKTTLHYIHAHKTGALITASTRAGAILMSASPKQLSALTSYGENIGLAFQIKDDLLDLRGKEGRRKSDIEEQKITYPALYGEEKSLRMAKGLTEKAINSLKIFDRKADPLRELALYIVNRKK